MIWGPNVPDVVYTLYNLSQLRVTPQCAIIPSVQGIEDQEGEETFPKPHSLK
jgi:hypothetical protein